MSISLNLTPINRDSLSTLWFSRTGDRPSKREVAGAAPVFLLACGATLTIWNPDPFVRWSYEIAIFALAGIGCARSRLGTNVTGLVLASISLWGLGQLVTGSTVYHWATLNATLQNAAFAATALAGFVAFRTASIRAGFLRAMVWFGVLLSVVSVLAYFTSPGQILWLIPSPYPDNWGPFPSRNNFAQFLELCFPISLYQMAESGRHRVSAGPATVIPAAVMLAAGLASASRAGALLLILEMIAGMFLLGNGFRRRLLPFALTAAGFTGVVGAGALWGRLRDPDPLKYRREIFHSATAMITAHPWRGYGLGTFSAVYPEFAEFDSGASVQHAHNDWLEWAAEGGTPYAMLWAALAIRMVRPAIRSFWGLGVLAVFLHAFVDYPFARLGVAAWEFLLIAALLAERSPVPRALK
jgi:O-antigen ligase